ncbi:MAG TPA: hypothetical protein VH476_06450 [Solirubrobacterales bacterium]|jgi:hypothetical protein
MSRALDQITETRPPTGALAVIAVGLLVTVAAALLTSTKITGAVALDWEKTVPIPDSRDAKIPGGGAMRITNAQISASEENVSGYKLFRVSAVLKVDAGSAVGQARVRCRTDVPRRTIPAKTPGSRASYPRSSSGEDLVKQTFPEEIVVEFNSHGSDAATLEFDDALSRFVNQPGVVVSWPPYKQALQEWQWGLPSGRLERPLDLGFASIWRTTTAPSVSVVCSTETAAGTATTKTSGRLGRSGASS